MVTLQPHEGVEMNSSPVDDCPMLAAMVDWHDNTVRILLQFGSARLIHRELKAPLDTHEKSRLVWR
jgi:hypothetical protein